jgi:hypothetical protein
MREARVCDHVVSLHCLWGLLHLDATSEPRLGQLARQQSQSGRVGGTAEHEHITNERFANKAFQHQQWQSCLPYCRYTLQSAPIARSPSIEMLSIKTASPPLQWKRYSKCIQLIESALRARSFILSWA